MDLEAATMKAGRPGHDKMAPWTIIPIEAKLRETNG